MHVRQARGGVLVVGGGFAGGYVARLLGRRGATIVSPESFMLYTPLLPEAAAGSLEPRHVVVPLRQMCPHADLLLGHARSLDEARRVVTVEADTGWFEVEYENLVMALGSVPRTLPIPGLVEHGRPFKGLADAIALRNHVLREIEAAAAELEPERAARHLAMVVVGAGYAGVEALAEVSDLVDDALRLYPGLRGIRRRRVLVDAAPKILAEIPSRLGEYAARELGRRGFELKVGTTVREIEADAVTLSTGERIETRTVVWTAGVRPHRLIGEWGLPLDDHGRVVVDERLRVAERERVWALGDCAAVPNTATPGRLDPPTCQHALRQARRLARNLQGAPRPYGYRMLGQVATLGRHKGIADVVGVRLRGFPGWFVARSYHLYQLPLAARKLRVVADWTTALFFRRDVAELSMIGRPQRLGDEG